MRVYLLTMVCPDDHREKGDDDREEAVLHSGTPFYDFGSAEKEALDHIKDAEYDEDGEVLPPVRWTSLDRRLYPNGAWRLEYIQWVYVIRCLEVQV